MLSTQVRLVQLAKKEGRIDAVWYGGGESAGQDRFVELTGVTALTSWWPEARYGKGQTESYR